MESTKTLNRNSTKSNYLPSISTAMTYAQRYQHMIKLANYNEMNEGQIWREYEKLRVCLKELNEEVLYHMQKRAQAHLYIKSTPVPVSVQVTLALLEEEGKSNELRHAVYKKDAATLQNRIKFLKSKKNYLEELNTNIDLSQSKIKEIVVQNKLMEKRQKNTSKILVQGSPLIKKLMEEEKMLLYLNQKKEQYQQELKDSRLKIKQLTDKKAELQNIVETRLGQFKQHGGCIEEEANLHRFEELQNQKQQLAKFDSVYKRNYLIKLKELESLANSVNRHDHLLQEVEGNNLGMRSEIDQISAAVLSTNRKRSSMSIAQSPTPTPRRPMKSGRRSIQIEKPFPFNQIVTNADMPSNDKNEGSSADILNTDKHQ